MTDEVVAAGVRDPDRVMFAIEHELQPIGRIADSVPIELHARVERLLPCRECGDESREFGDVGFGGAANLDGHRGVIARTGARGNFAPLYLSPRERST